MQGYILNFAKVKDEDLIVTILANSKLYTAYRFYGLRHSQINIGYKIDFELEHSIKSKIPRLRDILHLHESWLFDTQKCFIWQQFIKLLYKHLKDITECGEFYFNLLETISIKLQKQNPKRAIIEAYLELLEFEGRLNQEFKCFICDKNIDDNIAITRGFLKAHQNCIYSTTTFTKTTIEELFKLKNSFFLTDKQCETLWNIISEGL
ncbi:MAG: recombination protein RecO [Campylobacterales bacterium]|nr:recombination protein RecO [Campylobacterales bacterium]